MQTYKDETSANAKEVDHKYKSYEKEPEKHPKYRGEWLSYWQRRSTELKREGIDPEKHNFGEEWKKYFLSRLNFFKFIEISEIRNNLFNQHLSSFENKLSNSVKQESPNSEKSENKRSRASSRSRVQRRTRSLSREHSRKFSGSPHSSKSCKFYPRFLVLFLKIISPQLIKSSESLRHEKRLFQLLFLFAAR